MNLQRTLKLKDLVPLGHFKRFLGDILTEECVLLIIVFCFLCIVAYNNVFVVLMYILVLN